MDNTQLLVFLDAIIGWRTVGVAGEEEVSIPMAPEAKTFVGATLGDKAPRSEYDAMHNLEKGLALASLLRSAAEALEICFADQRAA
jgi:hypothetical protein